MIIASPLLTISVELPPTFSRRIDMSGALNVPMQQVRHPNAAIHEKTTRVWLLHRVHTLPM